MLHAPREVDVARLTSAAADDTVRLWDLRTTECTGVMRFTQTGETRHRTTIAYDPSGVVFAAAGAGQHVKLFDVRSYDKGPFVTFTPDPLLAAHDIRETFARTGRTQGVATQ